MCLFFNSTFLSRFHKYQLHITILLKYISLKLFYYLDAIRLIDTTTSLETQHFLYYIDSSKQRCYPRTHSDVIYPQDFLQHRYILGDNPDCANQRMNNFNDCFLRSSDFPCHVALYLRLYPPSVKMAICAFVCALLLLAYWRWWIYFYHFSAHVGPYRLQSSYRILTLSFILFLKFAVMHLNTGNNLKSFSCQVSSCLRHQGLSSKWLQQLIYLIFTM